MARSEVELMSLCGTLYPSFALESFANTCLGLFFVYLSVLITSKGKLKTPARDTVRFLHEVLSNRAKDVLQIVNQWTDMPNCTLEKRFRFCRKVNATICQFSALVSLLAVTRWLHINNVNGFRYLGYSLTCPPLQAQILVLIAPVVPCYRFFVYLSASLTFMMLITGWVASCISGDLWTGQIMEWYEGNFQDDLGLTFKGHMFFWSCGGLLYLAFFQLPMCLFLYAIHGGSKSKHGLPEGYVRLICLVWITWMCFPVWWSISYEGFKLLDDTKMNGIGFVMLNFLSKGGFTVTVLRMVRLHKQKGIIGSPAVENDEWLGSFGTGEADGTQSAESATKQPMKPIPTTVSGDAWFTGILGKYESDSKPHHAAAGKPVAAQPQGGMMHATPSQMSGDAWFTNILNKYESKDGMLPQARAPPTSAEGWATQVALCDSDILMEEVMRRLADQQLELVPGSGVRPDQQQGAGQSAASGVLDEDEGECPKMLNV
mmetsp:Transcript_4640/g.11235  ORF Transcript_4640/g.11235 Transcript_4640/m.11235 type:complete len:487 (-) Transcript_4640:276-1736(-)